MNFIRALVVLVAVGVQTMAADIGLYDISDISRPQVLRDQLGEITISSQSNNNKRYYLAIHAAHFFSLPCARIGLVVGNKTIHFESQGEDEKGRFTSMETTIDDPEVIPQIAQYFHVEVKNRQHPWHQMLVKFVPAKTRFTLGEPVTVYLRITNIGDRDFAFIQGGRQRGSRDNQFAFSAEFGGKMISDTGNPQNFGGLGLPVTLKPGRTHEISVDLTRWFSFKEAGTYNVRGSYYMEFFKPASEDLYTIWEDFACEEFTIEIKS
jgi:hypothetical protein